MVFFISHKDFHGYVEERENGLVIELQDIDDDAAAEDADLAEITVRTRALMAEYLHFTASNDNKPVRLISKETR